MEKNYFVNKGVSDREWKSLSSLGAHQSKLAADCQTIIADLKAIDDETYTQTKRRAESNKLVWYREERRVIIERVEKIQKFIIPKLNDLKKRFLYVDYSKEMR